MPCETLRYSTGTYYTDTPSHRHWSTVLSVDAHAVHQWRVGGAGSGGTGNKNLVFVISGSGVADDEDKTTPLGVVCVC